MGGEQCNEEKPSCAGCRKRIVPCEYPPADAPQYQASSSRSGLVTPDSGGPELGVGSGGVQFDMQDMALWHQFITETGGSISEAWEDTIPRLGLECDYLMVNAIRGFLFLCFRGFRGFEED